MYKKMLIVIGAITLILTGCVRMTNQIDTTIESVMAKEIVKDNTVSTGYKLYIPTGVKQVSDKNFNQKLKIRDRYVYLYVDTISYYYKNTLNYKKSEEYNYYYKEIKLNDK